MADESQNSVEQEEPDRKENTLCVAACVKLTSRSYYCRAAEAVRGLPGAARGRGTSAREGEGTGNFKGDRNGLCFDCAGGSVAAERDVSNTKTMPLKREHFMIHKLHLNKVNFTRK